ncbi:MAG: DedA family protein [Actinomycetota bacterium]|nr:DedA family protein [Actinomycetota bacterium]MDA8279894.1 DedA family protein [Actinomycetota bacterium]
MLALLNPTTLVASSGYAAVFFLSVLQSCCVPTSSELTLGFAGVLAAEGKLSLPGAIAAGVAGELVGAFVAWFIGRSAGRAVVDRFGKYILLSHHDLDRAEQWYDRHQRWGVFGSRLLPVIRNFVALPAGIAEVPAVRFGVLTFFGSLIWDSAMAGIGYGVGGRWQAIMHGFSDAGYVLGALAVAAIAFVIAHRYRSYKSATGERGPIGAHAPGAARHAEAQKVPVPAADRMPMASADEPAAVKRQLPPPAVRIIRREPAAGE